MSKSLDNPNFIGSAEVCERIGIDRSTLTRWLQLGRIAYALKMPGQSGVYLFDPVEVERARLDYQAGQVS